MASSIDLHPKAVTKFQRIRKLRHLQAGEISARCSLLLQRWQDRRRYRQSRRGALPSAWSPTPDIVQSAAGLLLGSRTAAGEHFALVDGAVSQAFRKEAEIRACDSLAGRLKLLGHPLDVSGIIDWHRDPISGYVWPLHFYADVNTGDREDVDVKFVWELNRHQFLVDLSIGWRLTGDARYAARVRELMLDWIDANPIYEGVNWTSALEVAMRVISWWWCLALLSDWDGWTEQHQKRIAGALGDHGDYLAGHMSFYSSPYNHLIGEATGLLLIAALLKSHPRSDAWSRRARSILTEHAPRQFYADGFSVEQATGYHFFTLGFLTQALIVARRQDEPIEVVECCVRSGFQAAVGFCQPDGRWPPLGDVDSARSIPIRPADEWDFRGICSLVAVLMQDPVLKHVGGSPGEELFWILGCDGLRQFDEMPSQAPTTAAVLPQAGYAVTRSDETSKADWLLFDAGPIADGLHRDSTPSVAHGHADTLGLLLYRAGRPSLIDSGTPSYNGPRPGVDYFRSPGAHNTIEIDGLPMARPAGRLAWSHVAYTCQLDACLTPDVWMLRGTMQLGKCATIERHILGLPHCGYWIADRIQLDTRRRIRWYWQLGATADCDPHIALEPRIVQEPAADACVADCPGILAAWCKGAKISAKIVAASPASPVGWHSTSYGRQKPGYSVVWDAEATKVLTVTFIGEKLVPVLVQMGSDICRCGETQGDLANDGLMDSPPDIVWRVENVGDNLACANLYAAGSAAGGEWNALTGVGNWSGFQRTVPLRGAGASQAVGTPCESV